MTMIRLDLLYPNAMLRRIPLSELINGFGFRVLYKLKGTSRRELFNTFAIAHCSFNELGGVWTNDCEWYCEDQ